MAAAYPPSYYAASAKPFPRQPVLEGDLAADLVVVGGGYTGLSTALHAAERGLSVILLEARRIGWGASGRNGGQMIPGLRWGAKELVAALGEGRARELLLLANSAAGKVRGRIARHAIACDLRHGHFTAAVKPAHLDAMKRELEELDRLVGYPDGRIVEPGGVGEFVASPLYHGGFFDAGGGHLHPLNYALGLAEAALAAGVRVFEDSPVTALERGSKVVARTAGSTVTAAYAVLATDTEIGELDAAQGRMTMPVANYNVATAPLGAEQAAALLPANAAVADSKFVLNYYRLSADNRLIFGGGEKYTPAPPPDVAGFVRPYLERVFPQLAGVAITHAWGGMVGVSLNRLPRLGRDGNMLYAHGWSGHGVLLTTLAGELLADALAGEGRGFDLLASLPGRPFPGGPLLRHPLYVLGMAWFALKDRL
ncbi:NAD(P)/FAD-dependent oxidoreductase [Alteraurantiacibacter buctensis]|uniref:FAD-dependent oxidoreductase n=1 Tax=Alteraurantiacibacter buctensis TaxID=1503981 RepID=A0A844YW79_9SPHN|nr:FAD-binding oxidoreductase [Alteraurantiacibacter buctensis]MXO71081.1 FAD-dependent oxidoreductase [Alteraurantiacibacter buctensis]